jgi:CheY-like chemotaxis protein
MKISNQTDNYLNRDSQAQDEISELKTAFLANMSHEIRTPLASIMGYAELLMNEDLTSEDKQRFLSMIIRNGSNLTRIIDDILDLSKLEAGHLEIECADVSLDQLTHEVLSVFRELAKNKKIYLRMKIDSNVPTLIKTDSNRLRQILINLIGNAVKFTTSGGIDVRVKAEPIGTNSVNVAVQVVDTGIGINDEQKQKLFKPFSQADHSTTRKYGGTGLGLTLSKKLALALKGNLQIAQSEINKGTTFELNFLAEAVVEESQWKHSSALRFESRVDLNDLNILLAEDAPDSQELIKYILTTHGANVRVASNGKEALQLARENKFDVVLMDIQMPELDGYEVTRTLRAEHYNQPIIALTAHAMKGEKKKSQAAGCDAHITKPLNFSQLISAVKEITAH